MERYLLNSEDFRQHYTCNYSLDKVPLENRQNILSGVFFFTIGFIETVENFKNFFEIFDAIFQVLYIPCLIAISKHLKSSSYKFMFVMGLLDIPALLISAIITAILGGMGEVYCSAPNLIYIVGAFGLGLFGSKFCILL